MIKWNDIVIKDNNKNREIDVKLIVEHTANTWQKGRSYEEKTRDTKQGKFAEKVFADYLSENRKYIYIDYDSFRNDRFKKHAPFDGLIINRELLKQIDLEVVYSRINNSVTQSKNMKLEPQLKTYLNDQNILTVEVKSTKVNSRKRVSADNCQEEYNKKLFNEILKDDFLTYPYFLRSSNKIESFDDYAEYIIKQKLIEADSKEKAINLIKSCELMHMNNIYVRIYIDYERNCSYIIGIILGEKFIENYKKDIVIKKMRRFNKSEKAIYLAVNLREGFSMGDFNAVLDEYCTNLNKK